MLLKNLLIFFTLCSLCSCAVIERRIYAPTQINTPSLREKNDHNFSVTISTPAGFDLNGAYALTNRLAIVGGVFNYKNDDGEKDYSLFSSQRDSSLLTYKHKGFHIGAGGYFPLNKSTSSSLFLSAFGTLTKGEFEMTESSFSTSSPGVEKNNFYTSDIRRWALQSSLHFYSKHVHLAITTRYNYVGYFDVTTDYTSSEQLSYNLPPVAYPRWSSFIDFGFDTKIFFSEKQKLGVQLFGLVATRAKHRDFNFYYYPARIGAGLIVNAPFKNKK